jgi:hypothetical protein
MSKMTSASSGLSDLGFSNSLYSLKNWLMKTGAEKDSSM